MVDVDHELRVQDQIDLHLHEYMHLVQALVKLLIGCFLGTRSDRVGMGR